MSPKSILITGASSGIGEALALHYAKDKATLFISGRNPERLKSVSEECEKLGAKIYAKALDVTNREQMQKWIEDCEKTAPLDLVIANAGVSSGVETPENIFNTFEINVGGVVNTIVPVIEIFKNKKHGQIALVSSIAGYHGLASCPSYSASKACIKAYGEGLRIHLKPHNIRVNTICPGFVRSRITDKNTCPMPFFMEADKAAKLIAHRLEKNIGLIAFPFPMRFAVWLMNVLPNSFSDFVYSLLPEKVKQK
jgi:short-subunit dehydrogenase